MTLDAWLQSRVPPAPPALVNRIRQVLAAGSPHQEPCPDVLLDAGERLLTALLGADHLTRNGAADLLTADALVTYAFEAAAAEPDRMGELASGAMGRLAALAAGTGP